VQRHGGTIQARSEGIGQGSEFVIRLPLVEARKSGRAHALHPALKPVAKRVLVVDDHPDMAESMAALLNLLGHDVRTATDGPAALDIGDTFAPEVVVLDLGMPGMDGCETARAMRKTPWGKACLLIALSGWGTDTRGTQTQDAGFDHHLVKPVDIDVLQAAIRDRDAAARS
jgi:CheY-like chemotaxis protein